MTLITEKNKIYSIYTILYNEYGPQGWWPVDGKYFAENENPFEIIVGAILTQNTSWQNADRALYNLRQKKLISPQKIICTKIDVLRTLIKPSGYYKQKAARLRAISLFFLKHLKEEVPKREDLLKVTGIGPETADSILLYAFHTPVFVVDAYTKRMFIHLDLVEKDDMYTDIQNIFLNSLPCDHSLFNEYHALIVKHGKEVCRKRTLCSICILRKKKVCSFNFFITGK